MSTSFDAILLVGPTGAGKTPLGETLEQMGLWGRRCFHFDFGASLRGVAESQIAPSSLTQRDMQIIRDSLSTGKLLENETFYIAQAILMDFALVKVMQPEDLLVLNGLPRHVGQAKDTDRIVHVKAVVYLDCTASVVRERIRLDSGGDRAGRIDDAPEAVERKLQLFKDRTFPLLDHYREQGARIENMPILVNTSLAEIHRQLEQSAVV